MALCKVSYKKKVMVTLWMGRDGGRDEKQETRKRVNMVEEVMAAPFVFCFTMLTLFIRFPIIISTLLTSNLSGR